MLLKLTLDISQATAEQTTYGGMAAYHYYKFLSIQGPHAHARQKSVLGLSVSLLWFTRFITYPQKVRFRSETLSVWRPLTAGDFRLGVRLCRSSQSSEPSTGAVGVRHLVQEEAETSTEIAETDHLHSQCGPRLTTRQSVASGWPGRPSSSAFSSRFRSSSVTTCSPSQRSGFSVLCVTEAPTDQRRVSQLPLQARVP